MKKTLRKWLFFGMHLVGFFLLWLVIKDLHWGSFFKELRSFPVWKYATGLLLLSLVYTMKSYRWHNLNRAFGINTSWRTALVLYLSAGFMSVITPGRLGEFSKIFFLKRKYGIDTAAATSSVILDRVWDVLALSLFASLSIALLFSEPGEKLLSLIIVGLLFCVSLMVVLLPGALFKPLLFMTRRFKGIYNKLDSLFILWKTNRFHSFTSSLFFTLASYVALFLIPVIFSMDTSFPIQLKASISAVSISNILSFIPVTIAGFGTRELVFSEVWKLSHYPKEVAISISTCYFIVTYLGSMVVGGVVYLLNLKNLYSPGELKRMK